MEKTLKEIDAEMIKKVEEMTKKYGSLQKPLSLEEKVNYLGDRIEFLQLQHEANQALISNLSEKMFKTMEEIVNIMNGV